MGDTIMSDLTKTIYGWLVHIFTASGAVLGVLSLYAIAEYKFKYAFVLIAIIIFIDAVDGTLARQIDIKKYVKIDGSLLDNMIDFFNYALVPAFFISWANVIPSIWNIPCVVAIVYAACYQFSHVNAKTKDHFFRGFPSYWNIAIFYIYYWQTSPITNVIIILILCVLSFIPIKYIYPSRLQYISKKYSIRVFMFFATVIWGVATIMLLITYPNKEPILNAISIGYILLYFFFSLYRTLVPIKKD